MAGEHHHRLTERDGMEVGIRCPNCGTCTSFGDILTTGACRGGWKGYQTGFRLDLVAAE